MKQVVIHMIFFVTVLPSFVIMSLKFVLSVVLLTVNLCFTSVVDWTQPAAKQQQREWEDQQWKKDMHWNKECLIKKATWRWNYLGKAGQEEMIECLPCLCSVENNIFQKEAAEVEIGKYWRNRKISIWDKISICEVYVLR